jgi:peroxiredoxin
MRLHLLAILLAAVAWPALVPAADAVVAGEPAPDFALRDTAGNNQRLSEWRGEVVLLSFWAEWCGRCSDQLRQLEALQGEYAARGVRVVTVNIDRDGEAARNAARSGLVVLRDDEQAVARQYSLDDLPLTLVVDPHGKVRHIHEKYRGGDAALYEEELVALLQE